MKQLKHNLRATEKSISDIRELLYCAPFTGILFSRLDCQTKHC